jgi:hypothetical protein
MFDPFQQQPGGDGPLGNLQGQVTSVLNGSGNENHLYISGGSGEPVFQFPYPRAGYRAAPTTPRWAWQNRPQERLTLGDVGILLLVGGIVLALIAAIAVVATWLVG